MTCPGCSGAWTRGFGLCRACCDAHQLLGNPSLPPPPAAIAARPPIWRAGSPLRRFCRNGHPVTPENRHLTADGRTRCKPCHAAASHASYLRRVKPQRTGLSAAAAVPVVRVPLSLSQRIAEYAAQLVGEGWPAELAEQRAARAFTDYGRGHADVDGTAYEPSLPARVRRAFLEQQATDRPGGDA